MAVSKELEQVEAALKALQSTDLRDSSSWGWWSKARREEVERLYKAIGTALATLSENELASGVTQDLAFLWDQLDALRIAYEGDPTYLSRVKTWDSAVPAAAVRQRLVEIRKRLGHILTTGQPEPPPFDRRKLLLLLGGAGLAALMPSSVGKLFRNEALSPLEQAEIANVGSAAKAQAAWRPEPGLYLQFGAYNTAQEAGAALQQLGGQGLKAFAAVGPAPRFKLLLPQRFPDIEAAFDAIDNLEGPLAETGVGIVEVKSDGSTIWHKTRERQILDEMQLRRLEEFSARQYHRFVSEAVRRYPLTDNVDWDMLLVHNLIQIESSGRPKMKSKRGAKGLMQLRDVPTDSTWLKMHKISPYFHGAIARKHRCDPYDPEQNIDAGVRYLNYLRRKFPDQPIEVHLRMYNAGERKVLRKLVRNYSYSSNVLAGLVTGPGKMQ